MDQERHPFHKAIGHCIKNNIQQDENIKIIMDPACDDEASHNIPLFYTDPDSIQKDRFNKSNKTELCNVDILILKKEKIRVIIEIEESNVKPTQICGKFLTSALSTYYESKDYPMADSVAFLQVLDMSKLKGKSSKPRQWKNLERAIKELLPINNIKDYFLIYGKKADFENEDSKSYKDLIDYLKKSLE